MKEGTLKEMCVDVKDSYLIFTADHRREHAERKLQKKKALRKRANSIDAKVL